MFNQLNPQSARLAENLVSDARKRGLVVFVGSGINAEAAPQWGELMDKLLKLAIQETAIEEPVITKLTEPLTHWWKQNFDVLAQASIIKEILGTERYKCEIQNAIYMDPLNVEKDLRAYCQSPLTNKKLSNRFELLRTIGELCQLGQVKAVATFNFDSLLECAIRACGKNKRKARIPISYFGKVLSWNEQNSSGGIPIYHVHGLLPSPTEALNPEMHVVMSYDEYFDTNADPFSWETSTSIHLLRDCFKIQKTSWFCWGLINLAYKKSARKSDELLTWALV